MSPTSQNLEKMLSKRATTLLQLDILVKTEPLNWLAAITGGHTWQASLRSTSKDATSVSAIERISTLQRRSIHKKYRKDLGS